MRPFFILNHPYHKIELLHGSHAALFHYSDEGLIGEYLVFNESWVSCLCYGCPVFAAVFAVFFGYITRQ